LSDFVSFDTVHPLVRRTSPIRRRLFSLYSLTAAFTIAWLAPIPQASSLQPPSTVARTVAISIGSFSAASGPNQFRTSGTSLRAVVPIRTPAVPVCSSIWSTMVAFSWHEDGAGGVAAAVRTTAGTTPPVLDDTDAQPDVRSRDFHPNLQTSDLYWTGGSHCVRLSLRLPAGVTVSELQADFLNTSGTAAGPGTGPPDTPAPGTPAPAPFGATSAAAMTSRPQMVTRAEWGAMKPRKHCLAYVPSVRMAYVHHTSGSNSYSRAQSDDVIRGSSTSTR